MSDQGYRNHSIPRDILDELAARFIIPMREEERKDLVRVCFLIEQAHWFYIDFYVNNTEYKLAQGTIKEFAQHIFNHIPFLRKHANRVEEIVDQWKEYKLAVPTYGAILLNSFLDKVLLVQGFWAKASWGFPKGKVNEEEPPHLCAVREVHEETGFDISEYIDQEEWIEQVINDQTVRLYLIPGVPETTQFKTNTRCEIKDIRWFDVNALPSSKTDHGCKQKLGLAPNSFFMVIPFLRDIKHWIKLKQKDRLLYQHGQDQRARRQSERESYGDFNSPQFRTKYDKTPIDGRQRRDSDRAVTNTTGKLSLKKSLSRPESKVESRRSQEKVVGPEVRAATTSPAKTPQSQSKSSSRKQLFSESGTSLTPAAGTEQGKASKSEKRKKKKSDNSPQHLLPDGFLPKAWKNFHLDQNHILQLAFGKM